MKIDNNSYKLQAAHVFPALPLPRLVSWGALVLVTSHFAAAQVRGDFNGDGRSDLAIGIPNARAGGDYEAGEVVVIFGGSSGLSSGTVQTINPDSAGMPGATEVSDHFGAALAVGAPGATHSGEYGAGSVSILIGSARGITATGNQLWHQDSGIGGACEAGDGFGYALTLRAARVARRRNVSRFTHTPVQASHSTRSKSSVKRTTSRPRHAGQAALSRKAVITCGLSATTHALQ